MVMSMETQDISSDQSTVLKAFSRALMREAYVLTEHPELLWQQFYNRLLWEGKEVKQVLTPELEQRSEPGVRPWFHNKCRIMESEAFIRLLKSHTNPVLPCAFSPDGRTLASASWDKTLRLWDARTGEEQALLKGHTRIVCSCAFSPDGRTLASASEDKTVRLWDARIGEPIYTFPCPGSVNACAFNPSGEMLAAGDSGGNIYILELIGFEIGPIVITAAEGKQGFEMRCPACQQIHPISQEQLGSELTCPTPGCGLRLKLNPFVIQPLIMR